MAQDRITECITRQANGTIIYAVSINEWSQLHLIENFHKNLRYLTIRVEHDSTATRVNKGKSKSG